MFILCRISGTVWTPIRFVTLQIDAAWRGAASLRYRNRAKSPERKKPYSVWFTRRRKSYLVFVNSAWERQQLLMFTLTFTCMERLQVRTNWNTVKYGHYNIHFPIWSSSLGTHFYGGTRRKAYFRIRDILGVMIMTHWQLPNQFAWKNNHNMYDSNSYH